MDVHVLENKEEELSPVLTAIDACMTLNFRGLYSMTPCKCRLKILYLDNDIEMSIGGAGGGGGAVTWIVQ